MKTRQQRLDELAVEHGKAIGANNRGGQDRIDSQRLKPSMLSKAGEIEESRHSIMGKIAKPYEGDGV